MTDQAKRRGVGGAQPVGEKTAGIAISDADENFTFVNPTMSEMLGYSQEELVGTNLAKFVDPEEFSRLREFTPRRREGLRNHYETTIYRKDGTPRSMLVSCSPLSSAVGEFEGIIAVLIDITERRRFERELEEAEKAYTERLEETVRERSLELEKAQAQLIQSEKMAAMGRLAAGVAHGINNPAGVLLMKLNFLLSVAREENLTPRAVATLRIAVEQTRRINQIVENLLTFSRPADGIPRAVDVNRVVRESLSLAVRVLSATGVEFRQELADDLPFVLADPNELEQVFINLINNAVDAMRTGGVLTIRSGSDGQGTDGSQIITVEIEDTGSGIPDDYLDRIFDPFFTTKQVGEGTGLGLAISYGIVQKIGGQIEVDSVRHEGTRMRVNLPVSP